MEKTTKLNRDFIVEISNSPYWNKRKVLKKDKTTSQYKLHFYNKDLTITSQLDGDGMFYFINNENDFPIKPSQVKSMLKRIRLERELKRWGDITKKNYNQIEAEIYNEMVK